MPAGHVDAIAKYLPVEEPRLDPVIYELVLNDFLQKDHQVGQGSTKLRLIFCF